MPAKTRFAEIASVTISGKGMGVAAGAEAAVGPVVAVATGALVSAAGRAVFASASANKTKQSLSFMLEPTYRSFYGTPAQPRMDAQWTRNKTLECGDAKLNREWTRMDAK